MTRPSSVRSQRERAEDVALTWIEEWLRDIAAGLTVIYEVVDGTPLEKPRLSKIETLLSDAITAVEAAIEKVETL